MSTTRNQWHACEPGQVRRMVQRLRNQRVWRSIRRDFAIGSVLLALVLTSYVSADAWANQPANLGGIMCYQVSKLRLAIVNGTLPHEYEPCVQRHLALCTHCRERIALAHLQLEKAGRTDPFGINAAAPQDRPAQAPVFSTIEH